MTDERKAWRVYSQEGFYEYAFSASLWGAISDVAENLPGGPRHPLYATRSTWAEQYLKQGWVPASALYWHGEHLTCARCGCDIHHEDDHDEPVFVDTRAWCCLEHAVEDAVELTNHTTERKDP